MSNYDREMVERLVPAIWDRLYAWGLSDERGPESDMPRSKTQKNAANTLWAHLADIRRAWENALLAPDERRALYLIGGLGLTHHVAAIFEDVERRTFSYRFERGVGKLADFLNGTRYVVDDCASAINREEN